MNHYSDALDPVSAINTAKAVVKRHEDLFRRMNRKGTGIVLVFTGLSGITAATRLAERLRCKRIKVKMLYIRKPEETSHGSSVHFTSHYPVRKTLKKAAVIFCDDFVSTGATLTNMQLALKGLSSIHWIYETSYRSLEPFSTYEHRVHPDKCTDRDYYTGRVDRVTPKG